MQSADQGTLNNHRTVLHVHSFSRLNVSTTLQSHERPLEEVRRRRVELDAEKQSEASQLSPNTEKHEVFVNAD